MCSHASECYECGWTSYLLERLLDAFDVDTIEIKREYAESLGIDLYFQCIGCGKRECSHDVCPNCKGDYCDECGALITCDKCETEGCAFCVDSKENEAGKIIYICRECEFFSDNHTHIGP